MTQFGNSLGLLAASPTDPAGFLEILKSFDSILDAPKHDLFERRRNILDV